MVTKCMRCGKEPIHSSSKALGRRCLEKLAWKVIVHCSKGATVPNPPTKPAKEPTT